ncbi:DUF11 domain-containing protein [Myxococcus sp. NMCA1]|uniref:DUF11 domain-containing protein n=1 Tax=Myxococcus sp. NMCA1 TaxID=2996785 RepID=UPI0022864062|nr:DUF11 domain-containing protein [Myxococcus sp. NMCA1]WAM30247.1 DUF11 domain-containing protein [Myxococcus sp. NMCA1]
MDPESLFATGASLDSDGDGVANADDNCIVTANPGQADLNGNGFGDACEPASAATDLSATTSASPSTAQVGSNLTLTLTVTNGGTSPKGQVFLSQVLPDGVTFFSVTSSQGSCQRNGSAVGCDLGALGASASLTVTVVLQPLSIGSITTSVEATGSLVDINDANNTADLSITVIPWVLRSKRVHPWRATVGPPRWTSVQVRCPPGAPIPPSQRGHR